MNPVLSYGGNVCCTGTAVQGAGSISAGWKRADDILVYTSEPFKEGTEVSGVITPTVCGSKCRAATSRASIAI
jgi:hypothetical protein